MKVTKERQMAPKTPTFNVEDPDGYDYTVIKSRNDGELYCIADGAGCRHVAAVRDHLDAKA